MRHLKRFNEELTFLLDYRWHSIMYQTKGLLEERHNALDTKQLREIYFMVTIK